MFKNSRLIFALFVLIAVAIFALFVAVGYSAGHGNLLMPLDDVYIHFQYAKQMALGQPYIYNPGQAPTSGATSFLYSYLLAFGYLIGFKGLWLGLWAMLIGLVALIAAQWAVYRLCQTFDCPQWLSILTTVIFTLTGSAAWHFMSGMETGLMITLTLWTLLMVIEKRLRGFILAATLLSIMRPEGGILVLIAAGTMFLRLWRDYGAHEKRSAKRHLLLLLIIPVLAIGVQPLVNLVMTGSTIATGNQAKSILATVPHDWNIIIGRIADNFVRIWWEFVTGYDAHEGRGWYLPLFTGILALSAIVLLMFKRGWRLIGLMLLGWLLASTAAIATLDTAFWHFKRYQMPMMALFFPLAAYLISVILLRIRTTRIVLPLQYAVYLFSGLILPLFALALLVQFVNYHRLNVGYVYQQPYQMALWLRENTPEDAVIAVHDVGMMRYMGERTTLDIVGLTTPDAAAYWRNGPGSVAEFLINEQPDYIANYGRGHGYGLAYLADTSLYGEPLASFPIENWNRQANVALAADFQGIYQPDWTNKEYISLFTEYPEYEFIDNFQYLNVADIISEDTHGYHFSTTHLESTFPTEVREAQYTQRSMTGFSFPDGYRLINEIEEFTFEHINRDEDAILATRVHPAHSGQFDVFVNDRYVDTKVIPYSPGKWLDIYTLIPADLLSETITIRIAPLMDEGYYMPTFHRIAQGIWEYELPQEIVASYQSGSILLEYAIEQSNPRFGFQVTFSWATDGNSEGDYRLFIHLYDDINQPPVAQTDSYTNGNSGGIWVGSMPVGNWLPGTISDTITLNIEGVSSGTYSLAIGFYNPQTGERLIPTSDRYEVSPDGRLWLGEVTIGEDSVDTQD
jgi:hypothetical protein